MFWFFGCEACGILAPRPKIEPAPPALEGEVLSHWTTIQTLYSISTPPAAATSAPPHPVP